ncbi:MAG: BatA domain-containing protein [Cyclobacteriaceae bacterium]|nr:BatA domain-containing protein [Cyclobacteriaceae bacterium]MCH8515379.1 BatA domain-containing protein [Cyclobacteriaceae bacterium]
MNANFYFFLALSVLLPLIIHLISKKRNSKIFVGSVKAFEERTPPQAKSIRLSDLPTLFIRVFLLSALSFAIFYGHLFNATQSKTSLFLYPEGQLDQWTALLEDRTEDFKRYAYLPTLHILDSIIHGLIDHDYERVLWVAPFRHMHQPLLEHYPKSIEVFSYTPDEALIHAVAYDSLTHVWILQNQQIRQLELLTDSVELSSIYFLKLSSEGEAFLFARNEGSHRLVDKVKVHSAFRSIPVDSSDAQLNQITQLVNEQLPAFSSHTKKIGKTAHPNILSKITHVEEDSLSIVLPTWEEGYVFENRGQLELLAWSQQLGMDVEMAMSQFFFMDEGYQRVERNTVLENEEKTPSSLLLFLIMLAIFWEYFRLRHQSKNAI